jgi:DNA-binding NarL/FixJ family response regulator
VRVPRRYGLHRPLTPTEQKIITGVVAGLSYAEIGRELGGISKHTVRQHAIAIARKIVGCEDCETREALIVYSHCMALIEQLPDQMQQQHTSQ